MFGRVMFGRTRRGKVYKGTRNFQALKSSCSEATPLRKRSCCQTKGGRHEARPACSHSLEHLCPLLFLETVMFTCGCSFCYFLWRQSTKLLQLFTQLLSHSCLLTKNLKHVSILFPSSGKRIGV